MIPSVMSPRCLGIGGDHSMIDHECLFGNQFGTAAQLSGLTLERLFSILASIQSRARAMVAAAKAPCTT